MRVAFYKGKGNYFDKAIRIWTRGSYSHCEIVLGDLWYSSSPRDGGVRCKDMKNYNPDHWDFVETDIDSQRFWDIWTKYQNAKYDWLGIVLTQAIPLGIQDSDKVFCSEFCAEVLNIVKPKWISPNKLYKILKNK